MKFKAAIFGEGKSEFTLVDNVAVKDLRADEVLVRLVATGVCHSDVAVKEEAFPIPRPIILGHEGAGKVERVGSAVRGLAPGDSVVLTYLNCGVCPNCRHTEPAYCSDFGPLNTTGLRADGSSALEMNGKPVGGHFFGQSSFAEYSVANVRNVVKVRSDAPLELLGPLGCGVQTGAGAVMNALRPRPGTSLVVFGAGGVGLSAAMAAVVEECRQVIVVEPNAGRRTIAKSVGVTHVIDPIGHKDVTAEIVDITGGGVNYAVETSGKPAMAEAAYAALAMRGELALIAFYGITPKASFGLLDFTGKGLKVRGVTEGDAVPDDFIPRLLELQMAGRFPLEKLVKYYPFSAINQAMADQASGATIKPIVRFGT